MRRIVQHHAFAQDGSGLRQITSGARRDRDPQWSPDGKRMVFHSDRSGRYEAWTVQPDGSGLTQLTDSKGHQVLGARWSPDGTKISWEDGDHSGIVDLSKAKGANSEEILPAPLQGKTFFPDSWAPDGRSLLGHTLGGGIWSYEIASKHYEQLTDKGNDARLLKCGGRILFTDRGQLFSHDLAQKTTTPLFPGSESPITGFSISPDEHWLCVVRDISEGDVWMANLDTGVASGESSK